MDQQEIVALAIGLTLIFGVAGVAHVSDRVSITERPYEPDDSASNQGATNATISIVQAMEAAEEETGGTAVEARLGQEQNTSGIERPTQAYQVNVLASNNSSVIVDVSAENGTVLGSRSGGNQTTGWRSIFANQTENDTQIRQLNLTTVRSGPEAVQLAQEEAGVNRTITEVQLGRQNGTLAYTVRIVTTTGDRSTVVVAAAPDEGGILSNRTGNRSGG